MKAAEILKPKELSRREKNEILLCNSPYVSLSPKKKRKKKPKSQPTSVHREMDIKAIRDLLDL